MGKPANIRRACRSAALELIIAYCFASHEDFVTTPDFSHRFVVESEMTFPLFHHFVHFPWITPLLVLKTLVVSWLKPGEGVLYGSYGRLKSKIHHLREHPELVEHEEHETVFHHLLMPHPDKGQTDIPSEKVLWEEAINLIAAGSETVATILNVGVFHVLYDPAIHRKLVQELKNAWPELETKMHYETLEKLPYLVRVHCPMCRRSVASTQLSVDRCDQGVSSNRSWSLAPPTTRRQSDRDNYSRFPCPCWGTSASSRLFVKVLMCSDGSLSCLWARRSSTETLLSSHDLANSSPSVGLEKGKGTLTSTSSLSRRVRGLVLESSMYHSYALSTMLALIMPISYGIASHGVSYTSSSDTCSARWRWSYTIQRTFTSKSALIKVLNFPYAASRIWPTAAISLRRSGGECFIAW